mmetsp:Transcript_32239/g.49334  ORF Transcript_32239/g.49334 Transcript_32239/m.49334 type:complete len:109 (+) Transcript_32239:4411-4737(+)
MEEIKEEIKEDQSQSQRTVSRQQTISEQRSIREELPLKKETVMIKTETIETLITAEQRTNEKSLKTGEKRSSESKTEKPGEKSGDFIMDKQTNRREVSSFNKLKHVNS